jgi:AraC-like DNA-binding protein
MGYREHSAPAALAPWLICTWERLGDGGSPVRVLPDGCIDVVWTQGAQTQVVGANTTAFLVPIAPGAKVVGVRMRPGAAPALLGIDAEAVVDARVPVEDLLGDRGRVLGAALERAEPRLTTLERWLYENAQAARGPDPLIAAAVERLAVRADNIAGLADDLGVSGRGLRRRVTSAIGYGPKRLGRVLRLWRALDAARAGDDLARAAFDAGYADQAHFSADCRELAGAPPTAVLSA